MSRAPFSASNTAAFPWICTYWYGILAVHDREHHVRVLLHVAELRPALRGVDEDAAVGHARTRPAWPGSGSRRERVTEHGEVRLLKKLTDRRGECGGHAYITSQVESIDDPARAATVRRALGSLFSNRGGRSCRCRHPPHGPFTGISLDRYDFFNLTRAVSLDTHVRYSYNQCGH